MNNQKINRRSFERFLKILACPTCGGYLELENSALNCINCKLNYPIRNGVPIFQLDPQNFEVMPSDHKSNQPPPRVVELLRNLDGISLHIGAGATEVKIPNCIELETSIYKNTDVVADAHHLPFLNDVFEIVVSFAVFEHLYDPVTASAEIFRVLKPGGKIIIHSAFLAPLHMKPNHYYNATKYGLRRWFSDFEIEKCEVSPNFHPVLALAWLIHDLLYFIKQIYGEDAYKKIAYTTLDHWRNIWINKEIREDYVWSMLENLPQYVQERFSVGFELEAIKPFNLSNTGKKYSTDSHLIQKIEYYKNQIEQLNIQIEKLQQDLTWQKAQAEKWWNYTQQLQQNLEEIKKSRPNSVLLKISLRTLYYWFKNKIKKFLLKNVK